MLPYFDLHCDTLMNAVRAEKPVGLRKNDCGVSFEGLRRGGALAQCFAVFLPQRYQMDAMGLKDCSDEEYIRLTTAALRRELEAAPDLAASACTADEIEANQQRGLVSAVLTMEDGRAVNGRLENLDRFYAMGFRMIALLWNFENCLGWPNSDDPDIMSRGLKPFGREAVERMGELGMMVDVSHLNEGGFYDVASIVKGPFMASHSNARSLSPHRRNLTDDQLRVLGEHGGVTGLNFCPAFLNEDCRCAASTAALLASHARRIVDRGGLDCCALGSDLDGTDGDMEIASTDKMYLLWDALRKVGFSEDAVEQIAWRNALRVWREVVR